MESASGVSELEHAELRRRLWSIVGEWSAAYLDGHQYASAEELRTRIRAVASLVETNDPDHHLALAVRPLETAAGRDFLIAAGWAREETFMVIGPRDGSHQTLWSIANARRTLSAESAAAEELKRWTDSSSGDAPISISAIELLPPNGGRPRFYVDALNLPQIGLSRDAQISIWEWTGERAECLFIKSYPSHANTHRVTSAGNRLEIEVTPRPKTFHSCGSCAPLLQARWTLMVETHGVRDEGFDDQTAEILLVDQVIHNAVNGHDLKGIASPDVGRRLREWMRPTDEDGREDLGMGGVSSERHKTRTTVLVRTDDWCLRFHLRDERNGSVVEDVEKLCQGLDCDALDCSRVPDP